MNTVHSAEPKISPEDNMKKQTLRTLVENLKAAGAKLAILQFNREGSNHISSADLYDGIQKLASGLSSSGLKKGDRVLLLAANSYNWALACLSVITAGGSIVPLDPQVNDETIQHILKDSGAKLGFADKRNADRLRKVLDEKDFQIIDFEIPKQNPADETDKSSETDNALWLQLSQTEPVKLPEPDPEDEAILFYTSGTTGLPKGVPLKHQNIAFQVESVKRAQLLIPTDRFLQPLPMFHVYPLVIGLLTPLHMGLPVIFPQAMTGPEIAHALKEGRATVLISVPKLLRAIFNALEGRVQSKGKFAETTFASCLRMAASWRKFAGVNIGKKLFSAVHNQFAPDLRLLASGGALLDPELAGNLRALGWDIAIGYGLTETSPLLCIRMPGNRDLASVGKPIPGVQVRIDKSVQPGDEGKAVNDQLGEIQAKGLSVFDHYLNLEDRTKEAFTDDGWFKTGDQGYMHDGNVRITGRIATMIVSEGGQNIQPEDVEGNFAKEPGIKEIAVLQEKGKLVALVVPDLSTGEKDIDVVAKKISEALRTKGRQLPSYYQITDVGYTREPLPRTNLGKLKRHLLEDRYQKAKQGKQGSGTADGAATKYEEMSSDDQLLLDDSTGRQTWDWLAERYPDKKLSMDTSPQLDLGVDSLEWLNLSLELSERTGVELDQEAIGRIETVRDLIREVTESTGAADGAKAVSPLDDPEHFLDAEQRTWLDPLSPAMQRCARILYITNKALMHSLFELSTEGLENVVDSQYIFAPNHASYLDAFVLAAVLDYDRLQKSHWAGWSGIAFHNPWNTFIYRLARAVPIDAKNALHSSLAYGAAVLKSGKNLFWFPEAERTLDGNLLPFKSGIGMLLNKFRVGVIPVYLDGTREALPPGAFWPKRGKITVKFGSEVFVEDLVRAGKGKSDFEKIANALRDRVQVLKDQSPRDLTRSSS